MRNLKNKEVIVGLVVLIVLCMVAIGLIIKREFPQAMESQEQISANLDEAKYEQSDSQSVSDERTDTENERNLQTQKELLDKNKDEITQAKEESEKMSELALKTYADSQTEFHTNPVYLEYTGDETEQLEELYYYWNEYKLEAVDDLIRLPRMRTAFTNELKGTNYFYYYGTLNTDGLPNGSGLAVYADNAYYCGEWKNGKRHGNGMWLQIFPDKPSTLNGATGVLEHSYNGEWLNDFPSGEGQEHIGYDLDHLEGEYVVTNVIGIFKDGYYDGELYIMTMDKENNTTDWEATAKNGVFEYFHKRYNASGKLPVWREMKDTEEDVFYWLDESENENWGIFSLKKMQ